MVPVSRELAITCRDVVTKKRADIKKSRLRGAETVMGQCGNYKLHQVSKDGLAVLV